MNWGTVATILAAAVGLLAAIAGLQRERSVLRRLERITAILAQMPSDAGSRPQLEAIQDGLTKILYIRYTGTGRVRGVWAFLAAAITLLGSLVFMGTGVVQRAAGQPIAADGTFILLGFALLVAGGAFLLYALIRTSKTRPRLPG